MLLTRDHFATFTKKDIADSSSVEVLIALSADSREAVDELADKALANGGSYASDPQEFGFMYGRSFLDPDGHHWEVSWMDMSQLPGGPAV